MTLDAKAAAYVGAAIWGGWVLMVGLVNLTTPLYGLELLEELASLYPGYDAAHTVQSVVIVTGYALVHGGAIAWLGARLYNRLARAA